MELVTDDSDMSTARGVVDALVRLRHGLGFSQAEVAERRGVSQASQADLERTNNPRIDTLISFASALGARMTVVLEAPDARPVHVDLYDDPRGRAPRWKAETLGAGIIAVVGAARPPATRDLLIDVLELLAEDDTRFFEIPEDYFEVSGRSPETDPGLPDLCFFYAWNFMYEAKHSLADVAWGPLEGARGRSLVELEHPRLGEMLAEREAERGALFELLAKATLSENQSAIVRASGFQVT